MKMLCSVRIDSFVRKNTQDFLPHVRTSSTEIHVSDEISGLCSVFKQGKLLTIVMKPTSNVDVAERRRVREVDAMVCAKSNIGTINALIQKLPVRAGASSPFALQVREKLREIIKMINQRSLDMDDEVRDEVRANEARRQRQAELDEKIGKLERELQALQLQRADLGKEDVLFTQHILSSAPPLPPAPPLTADSFEPPAGKGGQIASSDIVLFVDDVERSKASEAGVVERPKTPEVQPVERRSVPAPHLHNSQRKFSIRKN